MSLTPWTAEEMEQAVATGGPVLVDLRADWCSQCGPQERVLERLLPAYDSRVRFGSVDVAANETVVDRYDVKGLPTLLMFDAGRHCGTLTGFKRAPEVRQALEDILRAATAS